MPNYYINLDGAPSVAMTFTNVIEAKHEAIRYLTQVASEPSQAFWQEPMLAMTVTDEAGKVLFTLRLVGTDVSGAP